MPRANSPILELTGPNHLLVLHESIDRLLVVLRILMLASQAESAYCSFDACVEVAVLFRCGVSGGY